MAVQESRSHGCGAVFFAAGTPGATPQKELVARNYKGRIYQTHGVANPDFLRVVGKDGNGTLLPIGPMLVYEQLPDSNPIKKVAAEYIKAYEAKYGKKPPKPEPEKDESKNG